MNRTIFLLLIFVSWFTQAQSGTEGYYKDIFMDGGVNLYDRTSIPAATALNLSLEYIATEETSLQDDKIVGISYDTNGVLLYPDGEPRFRLLHTNGGSATAHGNSLQNIGRDRIRDYYYHGGSYTGVCAGAFITSLHYQSTGINQAYYHIFPGRTVTTGVLDTQTGHFIVPNSPLLAYYNFGNDQYIADIYHTGGTYANEEVDFPINAEILLRFDKPDKTMHNKVSTWAYKETDTSGRLVVIGSHPELETSGEGLNLMEAIFQYALDGKGNTQVKGNLANGISLVMNQTTEDNNPAFTKIGDKQYHHFTVEIPENNMQLNVDLESINGYHLNLYINKDSFAFRSDALFSDISNTHQKTLTVNLLEAGTYYVSVECETTVTTLAQSWGTEYVGNVEVLNGVPYTIQADYQSNLSVASYLDAGVKIFPNPTNDFINFEWDYDATSITDINLFDNRGKWIKSFNLPTLQNSGQIDLTDLSQGIYEISFQNNNHIYFKKIVKLSN